MEITSENLVATIKNPESAANPCTPMEILTELAEIKSVKYAGEIRGQASHNLRQREVGKR
jgi:hypothetical protein